MPTLTDPEQLQCYLNALANWQCEGYITFTDVARRWIRKELANFTAREIARLMHVYAVGPPPGFGW